MGFFPKDCRRCEGGVEVAKNGRIEGENLWQSAINREKKQWALFIVECDMI